ncbi:MAG TPA: TlpA disulfide reductase family protein [Sphingobium sp.]|nr:TlpA disulfide reductase family protein [Sphingobium sp.]
MRLKLALALLTGLSLAVSGCDKQSGETVQGAANQAGATPDEVTSDEVPPTAGDDAAGNDVFKHIVDRSHKGEAMPDKPFTAIDGTPATLKKVAAGKPMLVNLWATWCAPCVAELPALDKVAASAAAQGISVVAISQDQETGGVAPFWEARKLTSLRTWLDPDNALGFHYATGTLPTTILYDGHGKEVARIVGALDWSGPDGQALLQEIGG